MKTPPPPQTPSSTQHARFAAALELQRPKGIYWWTYDHLLNACILKYWQRVYDDPARCPAAAQAAV